MSLAGLTDPNLLSELIEMALRYSHEEFYSRIQQRSVAPSNTDQRKAGAARQLNLIADRLARIDAVSADAAEPLRRIAEMMVTLLRKLQTLTVSADPTGG